MFEQILKEALTLGPIPQSAALEYDEKRSALIEAVNRDMDAYLPIDLLIGRNPRFMMYDNHRYHAGFMSTVFKLNQFELLARIVPWVYHSYSSHGFSFDYFPLEIEDWKKAVRQYLTPDNQASILAVYDWMLAKHKDMIVLSKDIRFSANPFEAKWKEQRSEFVSLLIAGDVKAALKFAECTVRNIEDMEQFYLQVVQPVMYEIGTLWETDKISVAQEHLASSIITRVMSTFYPHLINSKQTRGTALVTAAPNEFHEIGARMFAGLLEADGWGVTYLGANTPVTDLMRQLKEKKYDVLAISVIMPFNLEVVKKIIAMIRAEPALQDVKVMVGGRIISEIPDLGASLQADGWAPDAKSALDLANKWWRKGSP